MAVNLSYVARETVSNLRRNLSMASAALLTVAVSLTLVGGALLVKRGVDRATVQWKDNVELSIFMKPDAAAPESEAVDRQLKAMPEVKRYHYVSKPEAFDEFRKIFANEPDVRDSLTVEQIPPSYRVVPKQAEQTKLIGERFRDTAGVFRVSYAKEEVDALVSVTNFLQIMLWAVAAVLLAAASLLILNTIRMAIFARRREVAVMKLVGATNWFIRIPFMLEGLIQGLAGAALAYGIVWIGRDLIQSRITGARNDIQLFKQFLVTSGDVAGTGILLLVVGVLVGTVGSALAVSRFLDV
ncbi:MAG: cell division transport system permease protein [Actinomycetota bacterium]|jgi:cell division transport system permease protein|nr:cell division transport system permease protein [Actinomycetota bacterium]